MDDNVKRRLAEIARLSAEGRFGDEVKIAAEEYTDLPSDMSIFVKTVSDFYTPRKTEEDAQTAEISELFARLIIVVYRDSKKQDASVANALLHSWLRDYPGTTNSYLLPKWDNLGRASLAFKVASKTELVLVWEQVKNLVQAYNEFLNGLLGFLIAGWRCALGKKVSTNLFGNAYGAKVNEFAQLTGGDDGAFYLIFRLAKPHIRNAIAHGTIWIETDSGKVKYTDKEDSNIQEIDVADFLGIAAIGSHLAQAYLVAIATIAILEGGDSRDIARIPTHLPSLFNHR